MNTIQMDMKGLLDHQRKLGRDFVPALNRGMRAASHRVIPILHQATRTAVPANPAGKGDGGAFNLGTYLRGWKASYLQGVGIRVINDAPHAAIVEYGRRPGARLPPSSPIWWWAQRKLGLNFKDAWRATRAIQLAIAKRGLLPRRVLFRSIGQIQFVVMDEVLRELDRVLIGRAGG